MLEVDRSLLDRMRSMRIRIDVPDADTAILHGVPTHAAYYNKPGTNVLIKRPSSGLPFVVCVDEDLEYTGSDPALLRVFAGGIRQTGWKVLLLGGTPVDEFQRVVEEALATLGADGRPPSLRPDGARSGPPGSDLLDAWTTDLSALPAREPTVGRDEEVDEVVSCLLRWGQSRLALIVGPSGCGKTNLLHATAERLARRGGASLRVADLPRLFAGAALDAERENVLLRLLDCAAQKDGTILAIERIELAAGLSNGPSLLARYLDQGVAILGTTLPEHLSPLLQAEVLRRRIDVVELPPLAASETVEVLAALRRKVAEHHHVEIDPSCLVACVRAAEPLGGCFPAKALRLLDAAAARASLSGAEVIALDDICFAARRGGGREDSPFSGLSE